MGLPWLTAPYSNSLRLDDDELGSGVGLHAERSDDAVSLTAGAVWAGLQVQYDVDGWKFVYSFHPDSAVFHAKEQRVVVEDWKSGTMGHDYDPKIPDVQLSRYAIAIRRMLGPSVETATLKKWYVNPDNPCHAESPLRWQLDLESGYLTDEIIRGLLCNPFLPRVLAKSGVLAVRVLRLGAPVPGDR